MKSIYDESYFLRGKETGKSLYEDYRWMPELTVPMVRAMIRHLGIRVGETVLDFGCARGYVVKAFRRLGYSAHGIDVSEWAINNCDDEIKTYVNWTDNSPPLLDREFDWVIAKDVLEHVPQAADTISDLMRVAKRGVFAVVPLSMFDGQPYVIEDYELDVTHIHRLALATWVGYFVQPGWNVECSYRVKGIKDNYSQWVNGNGFIVATRLNK